MERRVQWDLAAAATTAVIGLHGAVAATPATAVTTAEVAVGSQEPDDDEQDDGVLVQTKEASVASAVTHNVAPFLRALLLLRPPHKRTDCGGAARPSAGAGVFQEGFRSIPFCRVHVIL